MSAPTRLRVAGPAPYDVVIGSGALDELPGLLGPRTRRVAVIHPRALADRGSTVRDELVAQGYDVHTLEVPDGEEAKRATVATFCWRVLGEAGFTRTDAVVTVGGGATTDLGGFVAATWLRGIPVVHVPTTLLGMVDAAVGGKTGVNTEEGKNLVGAFHEPVGVLCDLASLTTLPRNELVSGLAEVIKCGFVADPAIVDLVEQDPVAAIDPDTSALRTLVERAVSVKAAVVSRDLREEDGAADGVGRAVLNYGHTLGHAVEQVEGYRYRHGAAVAIGMTYAAELSRLAGRLSAADARRHRDVLGLVGLPTGYRAGAWTRLHEVMRRDKKTRGDTLRFVVLDEVGRPAIMTGPEPALLRAAYDAITREC